MHKKSKKAYVYAIDPGAKTTGIYSSRGNLLQIGVSDTGFQVYSKFICDLLCKNIQETANGFSKVVVIIEDFKLYQHKADVQSFQQMQTSELIGALKNAINSIPEVEGTEIEIVIQSASQAKIWSNERLEKMGIITKEGKSYYGPKTTGVRLGYMIPKPIKRHSLDALRHMVYYTNKNVFDKCITVNKFEDYLQIMDSIVFTYLEFRPYIRNPQDQNVKSLKELI